MKFVKFLIAAVVFALVCVPRAKCQVRPNEFPEELNPTDANFETYSQKGGVNRRASLGNLKRYFTPVVFGVIGYIPTPSGNASNRMEFVTDPNGDKWFIDATGKATQLGKSYSGGAGITITGATIAAADPSATNELVTTFDINSGNLRLTEAGTTRTIPVVSIAPDQSSTNEIQRLDTFAIVGNNLRVSLLNDGVPFSSVALPVADGSETRLNNGTGTTVTGLGTVASPYVVNATDPSVSNELVTGFGVVGGNLLRLSQPGGGFDVALSSIAPDQSVTNEIQRLDTFAIVGNNLRVSLLNDGVPFSSVALPVADGSETRLSNGTGTTVTGLGTADSPYVVNNTGDTNPNDDITGVGVANRIPFFSGTQALTSNAGITTSNGTDVIAERLRAGSGASRRISVVSGGTAFSDNAIRINTNLVWNSATGAIGTYMIDLEYTHAQAGNITAVCGLIKINILTFSGTGLYFHVNVLGEWGRSTTATLYKNASDEIVIFVGEVTDDGPYSVYLKDVFTSSANANGNIVTSITGAANTTGLTPVASCINIVQTRTAPFRINLPGAANTINQSLMLGGSGAVDSEIGILLNAWGSVDGSTLPNTVGNGIWNIAAKRRSAGAPDLLFRRNGVDVAAITAESRLALGVSPASAVGKITTRGEGSTSSTMSFLAENSLGTDGLWVNDNATVGIAGVGSTATSITGRDANNIVTNINTGAGLSFSAGTLSNSGDTDASNDITNTSTAGGDVSGTFSNLQLINNAVGALEIADQAVITAKIADNAVTSVKVNDGAITTTKVADGAITLQKMAPASVNSNTIVNGSIAALDFSDQGATAGQPLIYGGAGFGFVPGTSGGDVAGPYTNLQIAANAVTSAEIADNSVNSSEIANGAVQAADLFFSSYSLGSTIYSDGTNWIYGQQRVFGYNDINSGGGVGSITLSGNRIDNYLRGSNWTDLTVNMPPGPSDGQMTTLSVDVSASLVTWSGNGNTLVGSLPTTISPGQNFGFKFYSANSKWIRIN